MPECTEYEVLISAQLDRALTPEEDVLLRAHLEGCAVCRALARELAEMEAQMPALSPQPPADLTGRIMAEVASTAQEKPRKMPRARVWGSLVAALALVLVGVWMWKPWQEPEVPLQMSGTPALARATPAPTETEAAEDTPESTAEDADVVTGAVLPEAAMQAPATTQAPAASQSPTASQAPVETQAPEESSVLESAAESASVASAGGAARTPVVNSMVQAQMRLEEYLATQEVEEEAPEAEDTTQETCIVSPAEGGATGGGTTTVTTDDTWESANTAAMQVAGETLAYLGTADGTYYFMQTDAAGEPAYYAVDAVTGEITVVAHTDLPGSWD